MKLLEKLTKNILTSIFFIVYIVPVMILDIIKSVLWAVLVYPLLGVNVDPFILTQKWAEFLGQHNDNKIIELS